MNNENLQTLKRFRQNYSPANTELRRCFLNMSAEKYLQYVVKVSNGAFKPRIERIMAFSDANSDYLHDFEAAHNNINKDVTVGQLLRIAYSTLSVVQPASKAASRCRESVYVVNTLLVYPMNFLSSGSSQNQL